jgi:hypothetical protein
MQTMAMNYADYVIFFKVAMYCLIMCMVHICVLHGAYC